MLRIRLTRMGAKKKPFYRVIIKEKRSKRDGKYLENLGFYNPMTDPPKAKLNHERIEYWIGKGAKPTKTVASLIKHNPRLLENEVEKAETKELTGLKNKKDGMIKETRKKSDTKKKEPEKVVIEEMSDARKKNDMMIAELEKVVGEEMGNAREDSVKVKESFKKKDEKSKDTAKLENTSLNDKKLESSAQAETSSASDVEAKKVKAKGNKVEEPLLKK